MIIFNYEGAIVNAPFTSQSIMELKKVFPAIVINNAVNEASLIAIKQARQVEYELTADPLFLEWQYDQSSEKEQAWRDKVAEIKMRYPLPTAQ